MGLVKKVFTEIDVEVEVGDFKPVFTWARVGHKQMRDLINRIMQAGLRKSLIESGKSKTDKSLTDDERAAFDVADVLVSELAEKYLEGWTGVPGEEGDLEYGNDAVADMLDDSDWIRVLEDSFFAAQNKTPEILIKNVLTSGAGGRPAGATTAS